MADNPSDNDVDLDLECEFDLSDSSSSSSDFDDGDMGEFDADAEGEMGRVRAVDGQPLPYQHEPPLPLAAPAAAGGEAGDGVGGEADVLDLRYRLDPANIGHCMSKKIVEGMREILSPIFFYQLQSQIFQLNKMDLLDFAHKLFSYLHECFL